MDRSWTDNFVWRWIKQIARQMQSFGRDQIVGLILAVLILLYQLHSGLIQSADFRRAEIETIAYPYLTLLGLYLLFEIFRAPIILDREREKQIVELEKINRQKVADDIRSAEEARAFTEHTAALKEHTSQMRANNLRAELKALVANPKTDPGGPIARLRFIYGNEPCIEVTNDGDAAEFWAAFDIDGLVSGERSGLFGRWAHTDSPKTRIVKSQTCRILVGKLDWDIRAKPMVANQWHIYSTNEHGRLDIPAIYTSIWGLPMGGVAPDIALSGSVFADPDLRNGPQQFRFVLAARGASAATTEKNENV